MEKIFFLTAFVALSILSLTEVAAQKQPTLQETFDWITGKVKSYTVRVGPPQETSNTYDFSVSKNSSNEIIWILEGEEFTVSRGYYRRYWVYPMRITSFEVSEEYIELEGGNIFKSFTVGNDITEGDVIRKDKVVVVMDMNLEQNLKIRMQKALTTFIALKKKKVAIGETF